MNYEHQWQGMRRTAAVEIFEKLYGDIVSLRLPPGSRLSEAEIANQQSVSRQPVREAFIRLSNMRLVQIQPQKATLVSKISNRDILNSRFIRTAVEVEVLQRACECANADNLLNIEKNLAEQKAAVTDDDSGAFHDLDYRFHELLCIAANSAFAFRTIAENKSHVDRLCMLGMSSHENMETLLDDHTQIFQALQQRDCDKAIAVTRVHLSRLDATLVDIKQQHPDYFED